MSNARASSENVGLCQCPYWLMGLLDVGWESVRFSQTETSLEDMKAPQLGSRCLTRTCSSLNWTLSRLGGIVSILRRFVDGGCSIDRSEHHGRRTSGVQSRELVWTLLRHLDGPIEPFHQFWCRHEQFFAGAYQSEQPAVQPPSMRTASQQYSPVDNDQGTDMVTSVAQIQKLGTQ